MNPCLVCKIEDKPHDFVTGILKDPITEKYEEHSFVICLDCIEKRRIRSDSNQLAISYGFYCKALNK